MALRLPAVAVFGSAPDEIRVDVMWRMEPGKSPDILHTTVEWPAPEFTVHRPSAPLWWPGWRKLPWRQIRIEVQGETVVHQSIPPTRPGDSITFKEDL